MGFQVVATIVEGYLDIEKSKHPTIFFNPAIPLVGIKYTNTFTQISFSKRQVKVLTTKYLNSCKNRGK